MLIFTQTLKESSTVNQALYISIKLFLQIFLLKPKTYEQDGKGDQAIAYLHYFTSNGDFYITEKDIDDGVTQAFGLASIGDSYPELGYISITELVKNGAEIDLHFEPKTLGEIKASF